MSGFELSSLKLSVDANDGVVQLSRYDAAADKADRTTRMVDDAAQRLTKTLGPLSVAEAQSMTAIVGNTSALAKQDVALAATTAASNTTTLSAKSLAAQWAAEAAAATAATAAVNTHTAALSASTVATTVASGATGLLARGVTALGGPVGVAVTVASALQVAWSLYAAHGDEAAKTAEKQAKAFEKLSEKAQIAVVSMQLARAEAERSSAVQFRAGAAESGNLFGVLGADKAIATAEANVKRFSGQLVSLRGTVVDTSKSMTGVFAQSLADANAQMRAFEQGGKSAGDAYKIASAEWVKSAGGIKTLEAALRDGDPAAKQLIADARALVDVNERLASVTKDAAGADAKAKRDKAAELRQQLEDAKALADVNAAAYAAGARDRERVANGNQAALDLFDKQAGAIRSAIAARETLNARTNETLAGLRFQVELIGKTKTETNTLIDTENRRLALMSGMTDAQADQFVQLQRQIRDNKAATDDWANALQTVVSATQSIVGLTGDVNQGLAQSITGTANLVNAVVRIHAAQEAARKADNDADRTAANTANISGIVAGFTAVAGIVGALNKMIDPSERLRKRSDELTEAYNRQFEAAGKALAQVDKKGLTDTATNVFRAENAAATAGGKIDYAALAAAADKYSKSLADIDKLYSDTAERIANDLAAFTKSNDILDKRNHGLNDEADALQLQIDIADKVAAAREKIADATQLARYEELLLEQARIASAEATRKRAEDERRNIFDNVNAALSFSDPRGASQATFDEGLQRRYDDAVARHASQAELDSIALRNHAEAADRAAEILRQDTSVTRGLLARIASATGNTRQSEDLSRFQQNSDELAQAIRDGMSPTNVALLKYAQFAEASAVQMQRAIEDGTKAIRDQAALEIAANNDMIEAIRTFAAAEIARIDGQIKAEQESAKATAKGFDDQISAIRENTKAATDAIDAQIEASRAQLDAAKLQLSALEKSVATNQKVVDALDGFVNASKLGDQSTLSPFDKKAEAGRQFEDLLRQAQGGNADAASGLPAAAQALLAASQAFDGSASSIYASVFDRIQAALAGVRDQFGATLPTDIQALEAARATVAGIERQIETLGAAKDAITKAAEKQISILQTAKDAAAEASAKIIDRLQKAKDAITEASTKEIDKLTAINDQITEAADAAVAQLIANETAAHIDRLAQYEATNRIAELTEQATKDAATYYEQIGDFLAQWSQSQGEPGGFGGTDPSAAPISVIVAPDGDSVASASLEELRASREETRKLREETAAMRAELKVALDKLSNLEIQNGINTERELVAIGNNTFELLQETKLRANAPKVR